MTNASLDRKQLSDRLNLGCGRDIRPGYVNLDSARLPGVQVVHDLQDLPLPFENERFVEIVCKDVLEHLDYIPVLRELHRILCPGGRLAVEAPHFTSRATYIDPTHRTAFSIDTFQFFIRGGKFSDRDYYFDFYFSRIDHAQIVFHRQRYRPWNYLVEPLVNIHATVQEFYEDTFLSRLFPASNIRVVLIK